MSGWLHLYATTAILLEYEELIAQKAPEEVAQNITALVGYAANTHLIKTYYHWNAITADPDDNKFFDAAVAAGAGYLISNDSHFNEARQLSFPQVTIISADEALQLLLQPS